MTEEKLERIIEDAANKFAGSVTKKWERRSFRLKMKSISVLSEIGLMGGAYALNENGYKKTAIFCFSFALLGMAANAITEISFRRRKN